MWLQMDWWKILFPIFTVLAVKWLTSFVSKLLKYPRGPWGLPIVGYIPWMDIYPERNFIEIAKKYGNVFSVTLGGNTVVVLNDWAAIKRASLDHPKNFSGRPKHTALDAVTLRQDVGFSDGPIWEEHRNLVIQCMKAVGIGKSSMENVIKDSIYDVMKVLSCNDGKIVEMEHIFFMPIVKTTWKMVAGQHFDLQNVDFLKFNDNIRTLFREFRPDAPFNVFPWLRFVPPNGFGFKRLMNANDKVKDYLRSVIESHEKSWTEGSEADFLDYYFAKMKNENGNGIPKPPYTNDHLLGALWDMFMAGIDTTSATLQWAFLILALKPEAQIEAQNEIDSVVGRNRLPSLDDYSRLPFTDAMIMEIQRLANVTPLSVPRLCNKTTTVCNVSVPKGATVLFNTYAVHHDPDLWKDPLTFNPRRFINEKNEAKWPQYLIPFSIGPRICVGKSVAELKLKLFISCLLHQFHFSLPPNKPKPSMEPTPALSVHPHPYSLLIKSRND